MKPAAQALAAALVLAMVAGFERPAAAGGFYWGIYTSPPKSAPRASSGREVLPPWKQPVVVVQAPRPSGFQGSSWSGTGAFLNTGAVSTGFGPGMISTNFGGVSRAYSSGWNLGWSYGPRFGHSFVFSNRSGLAFSTGRFAMSLGW